MNGTRIERAGRATACCALVLGLLFAAPAAMAHHAPGPCDFHRASDESVRQFSRDQVRCAAGRWNVPGGAAVALCIARRESGLIPWAESADGMNKGLFQQHVRYWDANYDTYTRPVWRLRSTIINGRTNAIVSIRMAHSIGWGPWGGRRCA